MTRLTMLLLMVAAAAAVASGCGGGDDDHLGKAEFVEQAQAACLAEKSTLIDYNEWGTRNARPGDSPGEMRARVFEAVQLPAIEAELAALRELDLPEDGAAGAEAFLVAQQQAVDAAGAADDDRSRAEMERRFDAADKLAKAYGIDECGTPGSLLIGE